MFKLLKTDGRARRGVLNLKHGQVQTPIFMPVGTVASVKTMTPEDLHHMNASIILGNTYHLYLRPGKEVIKHFGGLHRFMGWDKPILTDSGGFQIFSLSPFRKMKEEGAFFRSHIDGASFLLTPEEAVNIQEIIGSDIHMVLDECTAYPTDFKTAKASMERSMRWASRSRAAKTDGTLAQFGIIQGSMFGDLRKQSIEQLIQIGFEGYAIGGLSVGEEKPLMREMTDLCCMHMPHDKPRYLMGVGTPLDLIESVALGVDMFDCVMPTRNGRNGSLFTSTGPVSIKQQHLRLSDEPLDANCSCYTCKTFSRGYLRHLFKSKELTSLRLLTLHNLTFYLQFMERIRAAIDLGQFHELLAEQRAIWQS